MNDNLHQRLVELPHLLSGHLLLTLAALAAGLSISIPLGILSTRSATLRSITMTIASVTQTIPSLALLALMVPLLGGAIGYGPAFLALTLYSVLPTLRNTIAGIQGVSPALIEAARGLGMTGAQILRRIQLPLAAPVILAGVRTSAVWVVGIATLSTPVGAASLGNYIFVGLQTRNHLSTLFGCVMAALLAILIDQIIHISQIALERRRPALAGIAGAALAGLLLLALWPASLAGILPAPSTSRPVMAQGGAAVRRTQPVVIGAKTFTEQHILAELLSLQLQSKGFAVEMKPGLGSTVLFDALRANSVDCCIDYSGTIWTTIMKQPFPAGPVKTIIDVSAFLKEEYGIVCVGSLGFENTYALAMREADAERLAVRSIADLALHAPSLRIGGDYEFFGRPEWTSLRDVYSLSFSRQVGMDSTLMYQAVDGGSVEVISAFSTDGRVAAYKLRVLEDPEQSLPPYDAILLLSPRAASDRQFVRAMRPLINAISTAAMRDANRTVDVNSETPAAAAAVLFRNLNR